MRLHGLLGEGEQVSICVQSVWQTWGVWGHAPLENIDFGLFITHNLVESGDCFHTHNYSPLILLHH